MSSSETRWRAVLPRTPFLGTSALVAGVTLVSLTLVVLTAFESGAVRSAPPRHAALSGESLPPVRLLHPQAVAPTTTPPSAPTALPAPAPVSSQSAPGTGASPPTTSPASIHPPPQPPPPPTSSRVIVPPANPSANVVESPNFAAICRQDGNGSAPCISAASQATAGARADEGLGPMALPSNFAALSGGEQLFVLTDIERVDRGLPPVVGMVSQFDQDAQAAAAGNTDPTPSSVPPGTTVMAWASNWAEAAGPLGSNYNWMYNDGPGSTNLDCTSPGAPEAATALGLWLASVSPQSRTLFVELLREITFNAVGPSSSVNRIPPALFRTRLDCTSAWVTDIR